MNWDSRAYSPKQTLLLAIGMCGWTMSQVFSPLSRPVMAGIGGVASHSVPLFLPKYSSANSS